jgi:iron complex outermembrane receptor protein
MVQGLRRCGLYPLLIVMVFASAAAADGRIAGRVFDAVTGAPLVAATVRLESPPATQITDSTGHFDFTPVPSGERRIRASFVGYILNEARVRVAAGSSEVDIRLSPTVLPGEEVIITTTRASAQTGAIPHSNLTKLEIDRNYTAQDVPMLLAGEPGVYAYSDAGNGVGYSYLQVRGFDQRKVSVLVNGVPHNDPESHQVYWVDMPDLLESAADIQVQRGVGASLYGASAAGGVVSLEVDPFAGEPGLQFNSGFGSYGTRRWSLSGQSGLAGDRYAVYGRYSRIVSDGYRDQSWVDMWGYFIGLARYDQNLVNRFHAYGGEENLHLAYYGIDRATLATNRRFNPLTYEDETDTFSQPHYELLTDWQISDRLAFRNTLFYIKGDGYFIQSDSYSTFDFLELTPIQTRDSTAYDAWRYETVVTDTGFVYDSSDARWHQVVNTTFRRDTLPSGDTVFTVSQYPDAVLQRWVRNDFYGIVPRFEVKHRQGQLQFGGSFDRHQGDHFGQLRSVSPAPAGFLAGQHYYDYVGRRLSAILFVHELYQPSDRLDLSAGLQWSWKRYSLRHDRRGRVNYDVDFSALSPRLGAVWHPSAPHQVYASVAYAEHEPAHDDIFRPGDLEDPRLYFARYDPATGRAFDPRMKAEKATNVELGWRYRTGGLKAGLNGFYQWFTNEIVDEGGIDIDGRPIRTNAGRTIHRGIEGEGAWKATRHVDLWGNFTWSDNTFDEFTQYVPVEIPVVRNDTVFLPQSGLDTTSFAGNTIAGFPSFMLQGGVNVELPLASARSPLLLAGADVRHVGRIFLDNAGAAIRSIEPSTVLNLRAGVRTGGLGVGRGFTLEFLVNNVIDEKYSTSGYTYLGEAYYYPAAERNYFVRLRSEW